MPKSTDDVCRRFLRHDHAASSCQVAPGVFAPVETAPVNVTVGVLGRLPASGRDRVVVHTRSRCRRGEERGS